MQKENILSYWLRNDTDSKAEEVEETRKTKEKKQRVKQTSGGRHGKDRGGS